MTDLPEAAQWLIDAARQPGVSFTVRLANAYSVSISRTDSDYRRLLNSSGLTLPDGSPVGLLMRLLTTTGGRVRGPSLFRLVLDRGQAVGLRHFFLGASDETLTKLRTQVLLQFPGAQIAGMLAPPHAALEDMDLDEISKAIRASNPDIVWIALGTPKQDYAAEQIRQRVSRVCVGIGAAVDFVAGTQPEAPMIMRSVGLEWAFRLYKEPKRLWRRYLLGNIGFLVEVITSIFAGSGVVQGRAGRPEERRKR